MVGFKLNVKGAVKKKTGLAKPKPNVLGTAENAEEEPEITQKIVPPAAKRGVSSAVSANTQFMALRGSANTAKATPTESSEDSSAFLFDEVYDEVQTAQIRKQLIKAAEDAAGPKYLDQLVASAAQRKKDWERARDRKIRKENALDAANGEIDTEVFVTSAYRKKLEEREREEAEEKARKPGRQGLTKLYNQILNDESPAATEEERKLAAELIQKQQQQAAELLSRATVGGADVRMNDDGEIVDDGEVLSVGLNVFETSVAGRKANTEVTSGMSAKLAEKRAESTAETSEMSRSAETANFLQKLQAEGYEADIGIEYKTEMPQISEIPFKDPQNTNAEEEPASASASAPALPAGVKRKRDLQAAREKYRLRKEAQKSGKST